MKLLSDRLKWAMTYAGDRERRTISPADIARAAKASNATVNYWLNGVNGMSAQRARLVASYLGVSPVWLETGAGEPLGKEPAPARPPRMILAFEEEELLIELFRRADERGQRDILALARREAGDDSQAAVESA